MNIQQRVTTTVSLTRRNELMI